MSPTGSRKELRRDFPVPAPEEWRSEAERLLRGAPFDKKMCTRTPEGIELNPIYSSADLSGLPYLDSSPGQAPHLRGGELRHPAWWIAQEQSLGTDATADNLRLRSELEQGLDAALISWDSPHASTNLEELLNGIEVESVPLLLHGGADAGELRKQLQLLARSRGVEGSDMRGAVGADPLGECARTGSSQGLEGAFDELAATTHWCAEEAPRMHSAWLRGEIFHEAGAHAVQELGMLLAMLAQTLREMDARGVEPTQLATHMILSVGVGGQYFTELAKLRALRILVARILESCGVAHEDRAFFLHARCASRNKSRIDEHVNLLRATTEAFAAAAGGADSIHVDPFDAPRNGGDSFSRRLARNLQIVLREEARLARAVDPAGGSWYVEKLTAELAEAAWSLFREIEAEGGFMASLRSGGLQARLQESRKQQQERLATRRDVRVGTTQYPAPANAGVSAAHPTSKMEEAGRTEFEALSRFRECAPYERLREAVESARLDGTSLKVFIVTMGELARYMPRLDFTASAFEVGGLEVQRGSDYASVEEAIAAAKQSGAKTLVICGLDESYEKEGAALARALKQSCPEASCLLAGRPAEELRAELEAAGVDGFLHLRSDLLGLLNGIAAREGVSA